MRESFFISFDQPGRTWVGTEGKYRARAEPGPSPGLEKLAGPGFFLAKIQGRPGP
jgi:hypothetical protein